MAPRSKPKRDQAYIPDELWLQIFANLNKRDLIKLTYMRRFHGPAMQALCENLDVSEMSSKRQLNLMHALVANERLRGAVKSLVVGTYFFHCVDIWIPTRTWSMIYSILKTAFPPTDDPFAGTMFSAQPPFVHTGLNPRHVIMQMISHRRSPAGLTAVLIFLTAPTLQHLHITQGGARMGRPPTRIPDGAHNHFTITDLLDTYLAYHSHRPHDERVFPRLSNIGFEGSDIRRMGGIGVLRLQHPVSVLLTPATTVLKIRNIQERSIVVNTRLLTTRACKLETLQIETIMDPAKVFDKFTRTHLPYGPKFPQPSMAQYIDLSHLKTLHLSALCKSTLVAEYDQLLRQLPHACPRLVDLSLNAHGSNHHTTAGIQMSLLRNLPDLRKLNVHHVLCYGHDICHRMIHLINDCPPQLDTLCVLGLGLQLVRELGSLSKQQTAVASGSYAKNRPDRLIFKMLLPLGQLERFQVKENHRMLPGKYTDALFELVRQWRRVAGPMAIETAVVVRQCPPVVGVMWGIGAWFVDDDRSDRHDNSLEADFEYEFEYSVPINMGPEVSYVPHTISESELDAMIADGYGIM